MGYEYEGKTEAHASQKGKLLQSNMLCADVSVDRSLSGSL